MLSRMQCLLCLSRSECWLAVSFGDNFPIGWNHCCWCPGCPRTFSAFCVIFWDYIVLQYAPSVSVFRSYVASIWAANAKQTLMDGRRNYDIQIRETTLCKFDVWRTMKQTERFEECGQPPPQNWYLPETRWDSSRIVHDCVNPQFSFDDLMPSGWKEMWETFKVTAGRI